MTVVITPAGHRLDRIKPSADPRDWRFSDHNKRELAAPVAPLVDLEPRFGPVLDQGHEGACGPNAGVSLIAFLNGTNAVYSRQLLYWIVRHRYEGSGDDDTGVETRDVLKAMQYYGVAPEDQWPYDGPHFAAVPPAALLVEAQQVKLAMYTRLVQTTSYLACLSSGFPAQLGFECYESIDSPDLARTGVMPMPDPKREKIVGGHDVMIAGYDLNFKASDVFKRSGVDPTLVTDQALKIRNSWGPKWGLGGYFWLPLPYATNPTTGNDCWTGRMPQ